MPFRNFGAAIKRKSLGFRDKIFSKRSEPPSHSGPGTTQIASGSRHHYTTLGTVLSLRSRALDGLTQLRSEFIQLSSEISIDISRSGHSPHAKSLRALVTELGRFTIRIDALKVQASRMTDTSSAIQFETSIREMVTSIRIETQKEVQQGRGGSKHVRILEELGQYLNNIICS